MQLQQSASVIMRPEIHSAPADVVHADDSDNSSFDIPSGMTSDATSPTEASLTVPAHEKYFFHEDMTIFLVEDRRFRVHDYVLGRESDKLHTMVNVLRPLGMVPLKDTTAFEFETLLNFLFEGMHDDFDLSINEWIAVLSIATRYDMHKIRKRAVREITTKPEAINDVCKIGLAKKYNVNEWLIPAYTALCLREQPLDLSEAEQLGLDTTVKIARAREELQRNRVPHGHDVNDSAVLASSPQAAPTSFSPVNNSHRSDLQPVVREHAPESSQATALVMKIFDLRDSSDSSLTKTSGKKMKGRKGCRHSVPVIS